jgi:hypothetical protein
MNPVAVSVGFAATFVLGVILVVILARLLNDADAHRLAIAGHGGKLANHDQQLAKLSGELAALIEYLNVEVHLEDVPADWAEQEGWPTGGAGAADQATPARLRRDSAHPAGDSSVTEEPPATDEMPVVKRPRPEPPPTQPQAVVDMTPAVEARRSEAWDRDLAAEHERQARRDEWVEDALKRFQFTGRKR